MDSRADRSCERCGGPLLGAEARFCSACGAKVETPRGPDAASQGHDQEQGFSWETNVSLLTNPLILRQFALVVVGAGLIMALLLSFIFAATGEFDAIPPILLVSLLTTLGFGALLLLITLAVFGGRMRVRFSLDERGALWETVDERAIRGSRLALLAGVLSRNPQAAGAGALAASRQTEFVRWRDLNAVDFDRRRSMITLRNSWRPVMLVVCDDEAFDQVRAYVESRVKSAPRTSSPKVRRVPLRNGLVRTVLVAFAVTPLFVLSSPFRYDLDLLLPIVMLVFAFATVWLIPLFGWVVMGGAIVLAVQFAFIGLGDLRYLTGEELILFTLTYAGLAYLLWLSWGSLRGRLRPPLLED